MAGKRSLDCFMNIEDLPHLYYIFCRAEEYYQRVVQLCDFKDIQAIPAPMILTEGHIYWKMDTKPINGCHFHKEKVTKNEKQYMDTTMSRDEQDLEWRRLEVRSKPNASDKGEKYTPTEDDEDRLTRLLEDDIFKYIDVVNNLLLKNTLRDENISLIIAMGKAILLERDDDVNDTQKKSLPDIHAELKGLNDDDVIGYGYSEDGLNVLILEQGKSDAEKDILTKKITDIISPNTPNFIWCQSKPTNLKASPGEYLLSKTNQSEYMKNKTGYGSIGVFGYTDNTEFVFTTAGHVLPTGVGEEAFIPVSDSQTKLEQGQGEKLSTSLHSTENPQNVKPICDKHTDEGNKEIKRRKICDGTSKDHDNLQMAKGVQSGEGNIKKIKSGPIDGGATMSVNVTCVTAENFEKIGQCIAHLGTGPGKEPDFAVVRVDGDKTHSCEVNSFTNCKPCPSEISVYTGKQGELQSRFVQRIGPERVCIEGIVEMDPFFFTSDEKKRTFISVKSKNPGGQFAEPGNSGATVFKLVPKTKNRKPRAEIVSTILMGGTETTDQKHLVYTHRMDEDLRELEQQQKMKLNIANLNNLSESNDKA